MKETRKPVRVSPPGRIISAELETRDWTQKDLAQIMDRPEQMVNEIIRGKKQITSDTALELAEVFGTSPAFWANLEANYRLHLAGASQHGKDISRRSRLYSLAPVRELQKRGWIPRASDLEELEAAVLAFLRQTSLDQTPALAASFRRSTARMADDRAVLAWVRRVEALAVEQCLPSFDQQKLVEALPGIIELTALGSSISAVPDALLSLGIHFVVVPHLAQTYIDGAVLRVADAPVVAVSLRYDRIDSFWFTLMHELAHLVLGHEGTYVDSFDDRARTKNERQADKTASDWLLDPVAYGAFVESTPRPFSLRSIEDFARRQSRHPGLVVGRLQHEGLAEWTHFRKTLVNARPLLLEWIDTAVGPGSPHMTACT